MDLSISQPSLPPIGSTDYNSLVENASSSDGTSKEELLQISQQFESVLWKKFLDDATKPLLETHFSGNNTQSEIYRDLMNHTLAQAITEESRSMISSSMAAQLYIDKKGETTTGGDEKAKQ